MENIEITSIMPINNSEERKRAYEIYIYEDFAQAKKFILDDIENKILFEIKKDLNEGIFSEESFEELKFAYNEFEKVVSMEKEKIAKKNSSPELLFTPGNLFFTIPSRIKKSFWKHLCQLIFVPFLEIWQLNPSEIYCRAVNEEC